jgi:uncharacterized protein YjbI with pentapeptide repeats
VCLADRPYRHCVKILKWLPSLHDPSPPRLWRIGYALALCFVVALAGLAVLWVVALVLLNHPALEHKPISVHDTVGVAQLVFASVAGAGALVALVVAYRRQRVAEDRSTVFNERFATAATQLGDSQPAVRLAGAYAMAGLADDWVENRQTCVDVLCAYLRLPYDPDPGEHADSADRAAYRAYREVRHTIIRLIGNHLRPGAAESWQGYDLDFTGVVFDGGNFSGARFSGRTIRFNSASFVGGEVAFPRAVFSAEVDFAGAVFSGGTVDFAGAVFSGGAVDFADAVFSGGTVHFADAVFSGGTVHFTFAAFSAAVDFAGAVFSGGEVDFAFVTFSGSGMVRFNAIFSGGEVDFDRAVFSGGAVDFGGAKFSGGAVDFGGVKFSAGTVDFASAEFSGGTVHFASAEFSAGTVHFRGAKFSAGTVDFASAEFSGGTVDFRDPGRWSQPPVLGWEGAPPAGVKLPSETDPPPP